ncbi:MAG: zinc-ribbon domain-containing protein [Burkholderiales bacterium]
MFCSSCGSPNDQTAKFCEKCGTALSAAPPPPRADPDPRIRGEAIPAPRGELATGKSPGIALILSLLIPGVGQFYNSDVKKGAVMLAGAILGGAVTLGIVYFAVWIWSMIDAYQVAAGKMKKW